MTLNRQVHAVPPPADPDGGAREALRLLGPDPAGWVTPRPGVDHDVFILGGGQNGVALAYALRRRGIVRVTLADARPAGDPGPWVNRARMRTLRTTKTIPGPELGIAGLSFRAWYEARNGAEAFDALGRIPREAWADYVHWFRAFLNVPVRHETRLVRIEPVAPDLFRLHLEEQGARRVETARKVVVANGVDGSGGPFIPAQIAALPAGRYAHTNDPIDFGALRGRRVAVVGAAASAFDAAAVALETGAAEVHLLSRRTRLPARSERALRSYPGFSDNYAALPDAVRWAEAIRGQGGGNNAPKDSVARAIRFANFRIHQNAGLTGARLDGDAVVIETASGALTVDFVILGTGYGTDLRLVPEFADFAGDIATWGDVYTPPAALRDATFAAQPYFGAGYELTEKHPGAAPFLRNIHVFNLSGFVSFGLPVGDLPSARRGLPAIAERISRDLFLGDLETHLARLAGQTGEDFAREFYAGSLAGPGAV